MWSMGKPSFLGLVPNVCCPNSLSLLSISPLNLRQKATIYLTSCDLCVSHPPHSMFTGRNLFTVATVTLHAESAPTCVHFAADSVSIQIFYSHQHLLTWFLTGTVFVPPLR